MQAISPRPAGVTDYPGKGRMLSVGCGGRGWDKAMTWCCSWQLAASIGFSPLTKICVGALFLFPEPLRSGCAIKAECVVAVEGARPNQGELSEDAGITFCRLALFTTTTPQAPPECTHSKAHGTSWKEGRCKLVCEIRIAELWCVCVC